MKKIISAILVSISVTAAASAQSVSLQDGLSAVSSQLAVPKGKVSVEGKLGEMFDNSKSAKEQAAEPVVTAQTAPQATGNNCPGCGTASVTAFNETKAKSSWEKIRVAKPGAVPPLTQTQAVTSVAAGGNKLTWQDGVYIVNAGAAAINAVSEAANNVIPAAVENYYSHQYNNPHENNDGGSGSTYHSNSGGSSYDVNRSKK